MARILWKRLDQTDFNGMTGSAALSSSGGGARHIVLGTSQPGNRVESFLPPLKGNQVTIPTEAGPTWPEARLTFSSNPQRRNGEWRIADQKNNRHPAWRPEAGFPTAFDPDNPPVVFVLEVDGSYHVGWRDRRSLESVDPLIAGRKRGVDIASAEIVSEVFFPAQLSPINAEVLDGQLRYVDSTRAEAASSDAIVDSVRKLHLSTAARLAEYLVGSNAGPGFAARFDAVHELLKTNLTSERALQLAVHVRGLESMMDAAAERLDEMTVADISVFIADLVDLLNQLPDYRRFNEEARALEPTAGAVDAGSSVVSAFEEQPDEVVEPRLKRVLGAIRTIATERLDRLTEFALVRSIGNALRAAGRYLNERLVKFGQGATKAFDDGAGPDFGKAMVRLLKLAYFGAAIALLRAFFPGEFAFLGQLMRAAEALLP